MFQNNSLKHYYVNKLLLFYDYILTLTVCLDLPHCT